MICFYHSRDLDGMTSGAIVKRKYPDVTLIGYDYGEDFPMDKIISGESVIMIDVSLPMDRMDALVDCSSKVIWIDHHISAYNNYKASNLYNSGKKFICVFDNTISACEAGWKYLFPNEPMPLAVSLLGQYDTWRNEDKKHWNENVLPFQFGMRAICNSPETFPATFFERDLYNVDYIDRIINNGSAIMRYQEQIDAFKCKRESFEYVFEGLRAICLNTQGGGSNAFKSVYDESKHDIMMPFQFNGREWVISMYTTKDIDNTPIAKKYGGGGHAKACGFQVDNIRNIFKTIK